MSKKVQLRSSDNEMFEVDEAVAFEMVTVKNWIEDIDSDVPVPVPNVTSSILAKVIEYIKYHLDAVKEDESSSVVKNENEIKAWDKKFIQVTQQVLFDLISAANYLNIKSLLDFTCQTVADMLTGKTPEEIRSTFNIKNDFTPEEEEEVRKENAWAFE